MLLGLTASCAPAVEEVSKGATVGAAQAVSQPETRQQLVASLETPEVRRVVSDLAATAATAAFDAALKRAESATTSLAPSMREMARVDLAPSMSELLSAPEVRAALASVAFELSRQAVLGGNEATIELSRTEPKKGVIGHASAIFSEGGAVAVAGVCVLGIVILGLAYGLLRSRSQLSRLREQQSAH